MKKISFIDILLEKVGELGEATLDAFFPPQYPFAAIWRPLLGLKRPRKITRRTVATALWRLQKEGLIKKSGMRRSAQWRLTAEGVERLSKQQRRKIIAGQKKDGISRLVIFDVPERERRKREALRAALIEYDFRQLQKSVWIGEIALPTEFIELVDRLELTNHVHLFAVTKQGTLQNEISFKLRNYIFMLK